MMSHYDMDLGLDLTTISGSVLLNLAQLLWDWALAGLLALGSPLAPSPQGQPAPAAPHLVPGEETHVETALMQQRDMLRKELALARVCRADSIPLNKSLVFSSSSIWRGTLLRSWVICGR